MNAVVEFIWLALAFLAAFLFGIFNCRCSRKDCGGLPLVSLFLGMAFIAFWINGHGGAR